MTKGVVKIVVKMCIRDSALTALLWDNLNPDNKVSLFVRMIDLESGETETRIVNKHA